MQIVKVSGVHQKINWTAEEVPAPVKNLEPSRVNSVTKLLSDSEHNPNLGRPCELGNTAKDCLGTACAITTPHGSPTHHLLPLGIILYNGAEVCCRPARKALRCRMNNVRNKDPMQFYVVWTGTCQQKWLSHRIVSA